MGERKACPNPGRPGTSSPALTNEFQDSAWCQVHCCPVMAEEGAGVAAGRGSGEWGLVRLRGTERGGRVSFWEVLLCPRGACVSV